MEKFKIYVVAAIKNRFWILCGVVVFVGLGSWYVASANLRESTKKGRKEIEAAFKTSDELLKKGIKTSPNSPAIHPNAKTKEETGKIISELEAKVLEAWEKQYGHQGNEIFVWPAELTQTPRFLSAVQNLRPIESVPLTHEINVDFRGAYRDYIKKELPKLAEIIGAKWDPGTSASGGQNGGTGGLGSIGGFGGAGGGNSDSEAEVAIDKAIVDWSKANQFYFQNVRLNWSHMADGVPNTLQMLYAQEDLWVLQALLTIIQKTNGDADSKHNAAIRKIDSIQLGADAVAGSSSITKLGGGAISGGNSNSGSGQGAIGGAAGPGGSGGLGKPGGGGLGAPGPGGGGPGSPGTSAGGGPGSGGLGGPGAGGAGGPGPSPSIGGGAGPGTSPGGGVGAKQPGIPSAGGGSPGVAGAGGGQPSGANPLTANSADPAEGRYVDKDYKALSATELRGAASSKLPEKAYLAVAKRMPIRLSLVMDQNKLNAFLVECGNSPLTVEVRQVRFNRSGAAQSGGTSTGNGSGGFGSGGAPGFSGGLGGSRGVGGGSGSGNGEGSNSTLNPHPWDRPIEIYGIVYIYNPVDAEKLKLKAGATPALAGATPASPAGNPAGAPSRPAGPSPGAAGPGASAPGTTGGATKPVGKLRPGEQSPDES